MHDEVTFRGHGSSSGTCPAWTPRAPVSLIAWDDAWLGTPQRYGWDLGRSPEATKTSAGKRDPDPIEKPKSYFSEVTKKRVVSSFFDHLGPKSQLLRSQTAASQKSPTNFS